MYKLSQDFLEIFFSKLRARLGCNDNPSSFELLHMLKYILSINVNASQFGNCKPQDETDSKISPIGTLRGMQDIPEEEDDFDELISLPRTEDMSLYVENVVTYIAGWVCKKLCGTLSCASCLEKLFPNEDDGEDKTFVLLNEKNNGGLFLPSKNVVVVCKLTESYIRGCKSQSILHVDPERIINATLIDCIDKNMLNEFCHNESNGTDHSVFMIKKIAAVYVKVRCHYMAKEATLNLNPVSNRNECKKIVIFKGL